MNKNGSKYRMVSWWVTWQDLDWPSVDNLDRIRRRADIMHTANVNTATIFGAHFRWDFLPIWTSLHDYMATVAGELKQRDIALIDHHSATLIHRYNDAEGMRKVKMHSGPHLPFCPDSSAAADWTFNGYRLNQWRMIDLANGEPTWHEQYTAEQFCFANPEFISSYQQYVKRLIADTGISGLMCDDNIYFNGYRSCGCSYCRERFEQRFGYPIPKYGEPGFWGNWDNPDWCAYIDMRYENNANMLKKVREALPSTDFPMMSCCSGSSYGRCNNTAQDIRHFMRGCNMTHLEMCGNTPAWKHDPDIHFSSIGQKICSALHHRAVGVKTGSVCIGQGYGFTRSAAEIVWALNKFLGTSCWFSTLKGRLGLPESVLATLPDDASPVGKAFDFERRHPELFSGSPMAEAGVFFSYETRNHSLYGNLEDGYYRDFSDSLLSLQERGISVNVVYEIPRNIEPFSILIIPGALRMTEKEISNLREFMAAGGQVFANGPCALPEITPDFPMTNNTDITVKSFEYFQKAQSCKGARQWHTVAENLRWNPGRSYEIGESLLKLVCQYRKELLEIVKSSGYYSSTHKDIINNNLTIHLLAADFDTEIDRKLDEMRFHRSRVHYITAAIPKNVDTSVVVKSNLEAEIFTPLSESPAIIRRDGEYLNIELPPLCPYAVLVFKS